MDRAHSVPGRAPQSSLTAKVTAFNAEARGANVIGNMAADLLGLHLLWCAISFTCSLFCEHAQEREQPRGTCSDQYLPANQRWRLSRFGHWAPNRRLRVNSAPLSQSRQLVFRRASRLFWRGTKVSPNSRPQAQSRGEDDGKRLLISLGQHSPHGGAPGNLGCAVSFKSSLLLHQTP